MSPERLYIVNEGAMVFLLIDNHFFILTARKAPFYFENNHFDI